MIGTHARILTAAALGLFLVMDVAGPSAGAEKPLPAERSPPGDIPDTQVFVTYASPLGFSMKVPEGWSRKDEGQSVSFSDKYNIISVSVSHADAGPTAASVKTDRVPELEKSGRAVKVGRIKDARLKNGTAVMLSYTSNSEPNAVTNRQIRLEHDRYFFYQDGRLAVLDMAAPQGADNVDDWGMMASSFRWK